MCILTVAAPVAGVCLCVPIFVLSLNFKSCTATLQDGWTALYHAAWGGHTAVVEVLVAAGADMNIGDKVSLITSVVIVARAFTYRISSREAIAPGSKRGRVVNGTWLYLLLVSDLASSVT